MITDNRPPRMQIVWSVLEAAKDNGDADVTAACRRLINADRIGWREHASQSDWQMVREFAE